MKRKLSGRPLHAIMSQAKRNRSRNSNSSGSDEFSPSLKAREAALAGADIATLPMNVIEELLVHSKTVEGMKGFIKDIVPEYRNLLKND